MVTVFIKKLNIKKEEQLNKDLDVFLRCLKKDIHWSIMLLFFFLNIQLSAQKLKYDFDRKYTVAQLHEDIDALEKRLTHFHPDPYHYITKDSLHQFVQYIKTQITEPLNEFQFRFYVRQIVAKIGCGHTAAIPSKKYTKHVDSIDRPLLPINLWLLDTNKIYVRTYLLKDKKLNSGDEIISINGETSQHILKRVYSAFSSDGYNTTYKKQYLSNDRFKYYYASAYKPDTAYQLKIKTISGDTQTVRISNISSKRDTLKLYPFKPKGIVYKCPRAVFRVDTICKNLAIIDIETFWGRGWRRFTRRTFRYLRKHPEITNLAIDVRDNGGGKVAKGNYLLKHLIAKPYVMPFGRKPNLISFNPTFKMDIATRISPILFFTYPVSWFKKGRWTHYFFSFPKKRNHYKGNIYVLTNGRSFSMSSFVASYLKYKASAKTIGEETGGTLSGSNAIVSGKFLLPNTKNIVVVPLYHLDHAIGARDTIDTRHGVMPDYPTVYTIQDVLKNKDADVEKLRELCK